MANPVVIVDLVFEETESWKIVKSQVANDVRRSLRLARTMQASGELIVLLQTKDKFMRVFAGTTLFVLFVAACSGSGPAMDEDLPADCSGGKCDIWGQDDRFEPYEIKDKSILARARSTGMLTRTSALVPIDEGGATLSSAVSTLGDKYNLCIGEKFRAQPVLGRCSGFFAGNDIFVTAGHCLTEDPTCQDTSIVFDFGYWTKPKNLRKAVKNIAPENLYRCKEVILSEYCQGHIYKDLAILRLDRPVQGRQGLEIRTAGAIGVGDKVYMVGHPSGIPTKISTNGVVKPGITSDDYAFLNAHAVGIYFDLDMLGGNSGGPIFNGASGIVEGVAFYYSGQNFVLQNGCYKYGVCGVNVACPWNPGAYPVTEYADIIARAVAGESTASLKAIPRDYSCPPQPEPANPDK